MFGSPLTKTRAYGKANLCFLLGGYFVQTCAWYYLSVLLVRTKLGRFATSIGNDIVWMMYICCGLSLLIPVVALSFTREWRGAFVLMLLSAILLTSIFATLNLSGRVEQYIKEATKEPEHEAQPETLTQFNATIPLPQPLYYKTFAAQFAEKVKSSPSREDLNNWINDTLSPDSIRLLQSQPRIDGFAGLPIRTLPPFLMNLEPVKPILAFVKDVEHLPKVSITWGGGHSGFYGVLASTNAFQFPKKETFSIQVSSNMHVWDSSH